MSLMTEILDRLSGIAVVREKLNETTRRVDKLADWLDHERRIVRLEEDKTGSKRKAIDKKG